MAFYQDMPWHSGEQKIQEMMRVPPIDNPTYPALSPQLANHLQVAPTIAIGTLDKDGRPWTTLWGGEKGMARSLGGGIVGIRTAVTGRYDPVVEELVGKEGTGEVVREEGKGRMVGGLTIDLATRKRVKMFGRMVAGALSQREDEITGNADAVVEVQLVLKIEQSLGNCPKYLNSRQIRPTFAHPELVYDAAELRQPAVDLLAKADLFFMSTVRPEEDMDTNHRGGPPGFMRVASDGSSGNSAAICWPEYSGNRFYQSLGNMAVNPQCGICVPDFETGDMLYLTGTTEIFAGKEADTVLPKSNLCVKLTIISARLVAKALPFRGIEGLRSPYNPVVRYLASEKPPARTAGQEMQQATLLSQVKLTPTVSRFRFSLQNAATHEAGQYVTLDFLKHLDIGYSHMRNDDPRSLNDDFVRTFTVSSPPGSPPRPGKRLKDDEFDITVRNVGVVTDWLFKHAPEEGDDQARGRTGELEVGVKGFGGEFEVQQSDDETVCYIAAGVGITPLLPSLGSLDFSKVNVIWTARAEDLALVQDTIGLAPDSASALVLFVTGMKKTEQESRVLEELQSIGVKVKTRRMEADDVTSIDAGRYYLCTSIPMRKQLMAWLPEKELIFEDFNF